MAAHRVSVSISVWKVPTEVEEHNRAYARKWEKAISEVSDAHSKFDLVCQRDIEHGTNTQNKRCVILFGSTAGFGQIRLTKNDIVFVMKCKQSSLFHVILNEVFRHGKEYTFWKTNLNKGKVPPKFLEQALSFKMHERYFFPRQA